MESKNKGLLKLVSGLLLIVGGALGFVFGRDAKSRVSRAIVFSISGFAIVSGFYLFVDGVSDLAIGRVGQYKVGQSYIQPMVYDSKQALKNGLREASKHQKYLRRIKFECPDRSRSFTVYNTPIGPLGVPDRNVVCSDGFALLTYRGANGSH